MLLLALMIPAIERTAWQFGVSQNKNNEEVYSFHLFNLIYFPPGI